MMVITRYIITALAVIFGVATIAGYFGMLPGQETTLDLAGYVPADGSGKVSHSGSTSSSFSYPSAEMRMHKNTYYDSEYGTVKKGNYELVTNSDNEAGIPDQQWFEDVLSLAEEYDKGGDSTGVEHNQFLIDAMNNRDVVYWQEYDPEKKNADYNNGRKVVILYYNNDGDVVAKELGRSILNVDFNDAKDPSDLFKAIEKTITASEADAKEKSWYEKTMDLINASKAQPVVEQSVVEEVAPAANETKVAATTEVVPTATEKVITSARMPTRSASSTTTSGSSGSTGSARMPSR